MHRQLLHLAALAERPNISLRVVQSSVGSYVGLRGSFMILEFFEEPDLAYSENHATEMFVEEEADLSSYRLALTNILSVALNRSDSLDLVRRIAASHDVEASEVAPDDLPVAGE